MREQWKPLPGWEGLYEVSDHGRMRSLPRVTVTRGGYEMRFPGRILKPDVDKYGYHIYRMSQRDRRQTVKAHRAVMAAFVGPCPEGCEVAHNDGNKTNNRPYNLRYDTPKNNHADKRTHGTLAVGERHGKSKLTERQVKTIVRAKGKRAGAELAKQFGISVTHVYRLWRKEFWKHAS